MFSNHTNILHIITVGKPASHNIIALCILRFCEIKVTEYALVLAHHFDITVLHNVYWKYITTDPSIVDKYFLQSRTLMRNITSCTVFIGIALNIYLYHTSLRSKSITNHWLTCNRKKNIYKKHRQLKYGRLQRPHYQI